jgi:hypothetical protein
VNLNFYRVVLSGDMGTYENSVYSVDQMDQTKIISLFGFGSYYAFENFGPHFSKTRNSQKTEQVEPKWPNAHP